MHHSRKKSGHGLPNTSLTDVRKAASTTDATKHRRPALSRRHTPQKLGRGQRERERERTETWEEERESFPQFCMTCEKQFIPHDDMHLYCSDQCRRIDQTSTSQVASSVLSNASGSVSYPFYSAGNQEPRDIVPRASPSRPSSMHYSSPPTTPGTASAYSSQYYQYQSQGPSQSHYQPSSAVSALRSLTARPPSPPSPGSSSAGMWPFSRSAATSPHSSYSRPSAAYFSSTYDGAYYGGGGYDMTGAIDRPLPSRHPGTYSRPQSIELVTPMVGR